MSASRSDECCPRFDPGPWDGKEVRWENKRFVKDRVASFLRLPLNFGAVMRRNMARIDAAGAGAGTGVVLTDENSPWGSDVYIEVAKDVPGATPAVLSGTFLGKVFEGPYSRVRTWVGEMNAFLESRGKTARKLYFFYTTCPRCAKKHGKNYVVILAQL